ncbi:hypothetical protein CCUS01_03725 [Colletotrichum cuscutae]|uniref:Uncharacterized protein n=1 Tax=Colletotrichum cuscutae TaxID=1209917 RepID=A0AAI9VEA7_9PEZI|nr:hypothetical protein CCUS01_03725 [Colletotrichum cuscutae]
MTEQGGARTAKRIFVSVSKKSHQWSQALSNDKEIANLTIDLLNSNDPSAQIADADAMLVVKEMWPMRIWFVFDIFNTKYDPSQAHLPNQNDLPVIAVSLSKITTVAVASIGLKDKVNRGVRDAHDLHGHGSQAPFRIDHTDSNIPTYPRPRLRNTATPSSQGAH